MENQIKKLLQDPQKEVRQKEIEKQHKYLGSIPIRLGHKVWEVNYVTKEIIELRQRYQQPIMEALKGS